MDLLREDDFGAVKEPRSVYLTSVKNILQDIRLF